MKKLILMGLFALAIVPALQGCDVAVGPGYGYGYYPGYYGGSSYYAGRGWHRNGHGHHGGHHGGGHHGGGHHGGGHGGGGHGGGGHGGGHHGGGGGGRGGNGGGGRGGNHLVADAMVANTTVAADLGAARNTEDSAGLLAADYGISRSAAESILAIASGSVDTEASLASYGLTAWDVAPLAKLKMPTRASMIKLANNTRIPYATVERLLKDFIADVRAAE